MRILKNNYSRFRPLSAFFLLLGMLLPATEEAHGFGSAPAPKPPAPTKPTPSPTPPKPTPPPKPPVASNPELPEEFEVFNEVSAVVGTDVDASYPSYRALLARRKDDGNKVNSCVGALSGRDTFADQISYAVFLGAQEKTSELSYLGGAYGLPTAQSSFISNSLTSHPLCPVTATSIASTLKGRTIPSPATIAKANKFSAEVNVLREKSLAGDRQSLVGLQKLWSRFMMCLSYQESLTSADASSSVNAARNQGISPKPEGVKYYIDPLQSEASKLNIGLFQFTPTASGNIQACIRAWNKKFPSCSISTKESTAEMLKIVGSSKQTFNAFCGVTKVVDMFSVQVNTRNPASVHPSNLVNGSPAAANARCVTPFFHSNKSYNHFGPLQNTIHNNLDRLLTCTLEK